jgi:hypothetical protein
MAMVADAMYGCSYGHVFFHYYKCEDSVLAFHLQSCLLESYIYIKCVHE